METHEDVLKIKNGFSERMEEYVNTICSHYSWKNICSTLNIVQSIYVSKKSVQFSNEYWAEVYLLGVKYKKLNRI